jgi:hypothetical protein
MCNFGKKNIMKGFVYLFKHKGTNFIKIGMTEDESVSKRFSCFNTYAPNGGEIVHIIETNNARELESDLHKKYSEKRMKGEFFLLSNQDIEDIKNIENENIRLLQEFFWDFVSSNPIKIDELKKILVKKVDCKLIDKNEILSIIEERFNGKDVTASEILNFLKIKGYEYLNVKNVGQIMTTKYTSFVKYKNNKTQRIYTVYA